MTTNFEDHGTFYATQDMVNESMALSVNTGILYDITDANNVKIKHFRPSMINSAKKNIEADSSCWCGIATVMTKNDALIWEY